MPEQEDLLCVANSQPTNWEWPDKYRRKWERSERWELFADRWRNVNEEALLPDDRVIHLELQNDISMPITESLFIRDCYIEAEKLVWYRAAMNPKSGIIITGHPGIGKTVFIWYFLITLLQKKQAILFHTSHTRSILFYHDGVYVNEAASEDDLPYPSKNLTLLPFIWSLIDKNEEPSNVAISRWCFPVQSSSPRNSRCKEWSKRRTPTFAGFPLWTHEELALCARLDDQYICLKKSLDDAVQHWENVDVEEGRFPGVFHFLKETLREDAPESGDEAFVILLDALYMRFGPVPRDAIKAMSNFRTIEEHHAHALKIGLDKLRVVVQDLANERQFADTDNSHYLISLNHVGKMGGPTPWQINFKSAYIGKQVSDRFFANQEKETRELIAHFSSTPQTRGLAGYLFEPLAHRTIMTTVAVGKWTLKRMELDVQSSSSSPRFSLPKHVLEVKGFSEIKRDPVSFSSVNIPANLENSKYYVADVSNLPLFDSFLVNLEPATRSADIWILQMTTTVDHKGSKRGYSIIRKIMESVRELLLSRPPPVKKSKSKDLSIKVHYVLVRPDRDGHSSWKLPEGWDKDITQYNHQGDVHVLDIPCPEMFRAKAKVA